MSTAVIVPNNLPASIVALSGETMAQVAQLTAEAGTIVVADADSLEAGNALYRRIKALKDGIAKARLEATRPIDTFKTQIMEAERSATKPLEDAQAALAVILNTVTKRLQAEEAERQRLAREKAEREAAELRRQQEEERKRQLAEWQAAEDAKKKAAEEEAALFGTTVEAVASTPPPPAPAPVVPVLDAMPVAKPLPKSAVRETVRYHLNIFDRDALIAAACKDGGKLYGRPVLIVDEDAVEALLKAAVVVPGAKREAYTALGSAGGR
jgi:hypothetical protein